jgi:hypothetical protein
LEINEAGMENQMLPNPSAAAFQIGKTSEALNANDE